MASTSQRPTPSADGQDTLSDYIPQSNEISRVPSTAGANDTPGDGDDQLDDGDDAQDDDSEYDSEGDKIMKPAQGSKPQGKASLKKEAKRKFDDKLASRRSTQASLKSGDSIKRFTYLLGQTDLFKHFCDLKAQRDPGFAKLLAEAENAGKAKGRGKAAQSRGRKSEKDEDAELLEAEKETDGLAEGDGPFVFTESPAYVKGGKMREYQIQGLNWMCGLHYNGINGILADEMGLGKTLQTISFLGYLKFIRNIHGPHLVVVPKSTLDNWAREIDRWVPGFKTVVLKGTKEERAELCQQTILPQDFDICLASYEICLREKSVLKKVVWEYIVIDEAHRIKNVDSMLSQIVRLFDSRGRMLITGTPLQNNLHELWALLNFLLPDVFSDVADFDAWFEKQGDTGDKAIEAAGAEASAPSTEDPAAVEQAKADASNKVVKQLHAVLRPFLLRRVKMDVEKSLLPKKEINVYVGMTELQRKWYRSILEKDIDAVNGMSGKKEGKTRLQNIVMQLRKCCNHPYLFDGAEPGPPFTTDEHLVEAAGKMLVLDKLLKSMKAKGSRVLIFSQMSRVLDILEDFCLFREYQYCRLDGGTAHEDRMEQIDAFNKPDSEKFIFLLTTRAGGLGINLVTADIVVLYDSDWNPQADLQAMDRAHRIGQTKQVYVFRFVTENAVEEKVLERAAQKLRLDQLVIQQGRAQQSSKAANKDDLVEMIQHGAEKIINSKESMMADDDIDAIIQRGESKTAELNSKYAQLSFDELQIFNNPGAQGTTTQWEGEEFGGRKGNGQKLSSLLWIEPSKRERKTNYSIDEYYRGQLKGGSGRPAGSRGPRGPRRVAVDDFKFFPARFQELQEKEQYYFKKTKGEQVAVRENVPDMTPEQLEEERAAEQEAIDTAEPLTEEEEKEKEELKGLGFTDWAKREFQAFCRGIELYGRDAYELIQTEVPTKTVDEVREYASAFWERYTEIEDHERIISKIEAAEAKRSKEDRLASLIRRKVAEVDYPLQQLKIVYANQTKGKSYSEDEDRFLLVEMSKYGLGKESVYEKIKQDINNFPAFRFDWFIKSRTVQEISRRCQTLVSLVDRENGGGDDKDAAPVKAKRAPKRKDAPTDTPDASASGSRAGTPAAKKPKKAAKEKVEA
ncbi:DNA translocase [Rhodotorula paludigena]|uniref:DNA translocase n=1 Tax=Rhodotorula paludigena TaxID=86838 RepID=UPI003180879C